MDATRMAGLEALEAFLKSDVANARVTTGDRWLIWSINAWEVYERGRGSGKLVTTTADLVEAVAALNGPQE